LDLTVVIPVCNEAGSVRELSERIGRTLGSSGLDYEIVFVDDGSTDNTLPILRELNGKDPRVKVIHFNRNFGKAMAYSMGFREAQGEIVVTMDGDLQDAPEEIPAFLEKLEEGYDLVTGWKHRGKGPVSRAIPSRFFNLVTSRVTRLKLHDFNCPFKAYRREVAKTLNIHGELHRFIPVLAHWEGFRVAEIKVENYPRTSGKTKYGSGRFVKGFLDLLTVIFITRYIKRPLHLFGFVGLMFLVTGFAVDLVLTAIGLAQGRIGHQALLTLGLVLIIIGVQFIFTGLLGEMVYSVQRREMPESVAYEKIG
jgi:glycosyltransferase involved in cell wall biosynthesis